MTILEQLSRRDRWEAFYQYKTSLACPKSFAAKLRSFIDNEDYLPVYNHILREAPFPVPTKSVISKMSTMKKRTVYTYPEKENTVLKLLTWLLLRKYDDYFSANLYSFRPGRTAKDAVRALIHSPGVDHMYAYKADVSNYFNSVPVDRLIEKLSLVITDDPPLLSFLRGLLENPVVLDRGKPIIEQKGIMAGTPLSAFFANVYLRELDAYFFERGVPYARYSDDIIVFAKDGESLGQYAGIIRSKLSSLGLEINPEKENVYSPSEGWQFLGFSYRQGRIDISPASMKKLKQKMRRKTRALQRWKTRNDLDGEKAAKAFIRVFNKKLFDGGDENDLTWSLWYFPILTTTDSLHTIDLYAQDCIRSLISGVHTKARFNVRYEALKTLGFRSLVHEYYVFHKDQR